MQVRTGAVASRAHQRDLLAALDLVAFFDVEAIEVAVPRLVAGRMTNDDQATIAILIPVRLEHLAVGSGNNRRAFWGGDVQAAMSSRRQPVDLAEVRGDLPSRRP